MSTGNAKRNRPDTVVTGMLNNSNMMLSSQNWRSDPGTPGGGENSVTGRARFPGPSTLPSSRAITASPGMPTLIVGMRSACSGKLSLRSPFCTLRRRLVFYSKQTTRSSVSDLVFGQFDEIGLARGAIRAGPIVGQGLQ